MKTRIYFAHSKLDYGSEAEYKALKLIKKQWPKSDVMCPFNDIGECSNGMRAYLKLVSWADIVVVLEHKRSIGRGVYEEARKALQNRTPVLVIRKAKFEPVCDVRILNPDNWTDGYGMIAV